MEQAAASLGIFAGKRWVSPDHLHFAWRKPGHVPPKKIAGMMLIEPTSKQVGPTQTSTKPANKRHARVCFRCGFSRHDLAPRKIAMLMAPFGCAYGTSTRLSTTILNRKVLGVYGSVLLHDLCACRKRSQVRWDSTTVARCSKATALTRPLQPSKYLPGLYRTFRAVTVCTFARTNSMRSGVNSMMRSPKRGVPSMLSARGPLHTAAIEPKLRNTTVGTCAAAAA
jgi:hypothetical protein